MIPYKGPIYDLEDGTRLHDLDAGCPTCGKRLAEVVHDPHGQWNTDDVVCIDEGVRVHVPTLPTIKIRPAWRSVGRFVAQCSCGWISMVTSRVNAEQHGARHLAVHIPQDAA